MNRFGIETQRLKNLHNSLFFSKFFRSSEKFHRAPSCLSRQLLPVGFDEAFGLLVASTVVIVVDGVVAVVVDDEGCSDLLKTD